MPATGARSLEGSMRGVARTVDPGDELFSTGADTAVSLGRSFPGDPADRLIYATAIETGWSLVTKDGALRGEDAERGLTIW